MSSRIKTRDQIDDKYKWDLSVLYFSDKDWEKDFKKVENEYKELLRYKGLLGKANELEVFLKLYIDLSIIQENLYVYANVKFFEDTTNKKYEEMSGKVELLFSQIDSETVFIKKELSSLAIQDIDILLKANKALEQYRFFLESYARYSSHILSEETEEVLADLGIIFNKPDDIFNAFDNNNISWEAFEHKGEKIELSHATFSKILESSDRRLRKTAFEYYYKPFQQNIDVLANTYSANVLANVKLAKIRKYANTLEKALFPDYLPTEVFNNLVDVVKENIDAVSEFNELKKEALGVEELHFYDNYVPLVSENEKEYSYDDAIKITRDALKPLGEEYLKKYDSTLEARVIDVFESKGKRSGAFSWGSYASRGLVFLNHAGTFSDVSTFAHEFGHCLHRDYSIENQSYLYYSNPTILAEIASTFNEALLLDYMYKSVTSVEEKKFFLYHNLKRIEATFFRQTMFASFEKDIHEFAESGEVLTSKSITDIYKSNLKAYLGDGMVIDDSLTYEWARIPHFYNAFYVYKYATSLSAAIVLADGVVSGERSSIEAYITFLKAGSHKDPLDILQDAGVDLTKKFVYEGTVKKFRRLLAEYKLL